jgi:hypothetical protein
LRRNNCQLAEYKAWFECECNKLILKPGFSEVGPFIDSIGNPDSPPWRSDLAIIYPGSMYIRVVEYYDQSALIDLGWRKYFNYHYGPYSGQFDENGFPLHSKAFILRIETDRLNKCHIHYMKNPEHIPEDRLPGLDFDSIDPFKFIEAVEEHRKSSKPLHEILGFNVEPAK